MSRCVLAFAAGQSAANAPEDFSTREATTRTKDNQADDNRNAVCQNDIQRQHPSLHQLLASTEHDNTLKSYYYCFIAPLCACSTSAACSANPARHVCTLAPCSKLTPHLETSVSCNCQLSQQTELCCDEQAADIHSCTATSTCTHAQHFMLSIFSHFCQVLLHGS
jgi:hypothetical protein